MDSSGFSSPRSDSFPAGLRVLVVDDDPTWLKILEKMLKKCNYEVTTCSLARDALNLLRERKDRFDIVISDVNMPDMDGFKLLEHVGLEMDLPVIMMSVDGETSRVMKGVQHGACDYLLKPIRMKELRNIWQHVLRKRMHGVRDIESHDNLEQVRVMTRQYGNEPVSGDVYLFNRDAVSVKRRKEDRVFSDSHSSAKKARVVWSVDLHQEFVKAVNQIGFDKVGPKKILNLMGVQWLTRENVASHLQKYRLYLSRLEKENEQLNKTFSGTRQHSSGRSPEDSYLGHKIPVHDHDSKVSEPNVNGVRNISVSEPEKSLILDKADVSRKTTPSRPSFNHCTSTLNSSVQYESRIQQLLQYSWSPETSSVQRLRPDHKSHYQSQHSFDHLSSNKLMRVGFNNGNLAITKVESTSALFSVQPERHQNQCSVWTSDVKPSGGKLALGTGSCTKLWDEEFDAYPFSQVDFYPQIDDLENYDCEYSNDTVEYPIMDRGLFIA